MSLKTLRSALTGCSALMIATTLTTGLVAAQPTTTKSTAKTGATTETKTMEGTVLAVDGNNLIVRMSNGEIRHIVASDSQRALIEGREVAAKDLRVGTKLKATITTTTTSLVDRTVTVGSGKVWYVAGNNVILTLPNGENRQYKVPDDYEFTVEGKPATVFELRKGMRVSAVKIVEAPRTEVAANTVVTGEPPAPVATASAPVSAPAPASATPAPAVTPAPSETPAPGGSTPAGSAPAGSAPAPNTATAPAGAPATAVTPASADTPAPAAEPASAPSEPSRSPVLLIGLGVAVLIACVIGFRSMNRKKS